MPLTSLRLDPATGDLATVTDGNGLRRFVLETSFPAIVAQRLRVRLRWFKREWFLDRRLGVPYLDQVLGRKVPAASLAPLYRAIILGTPGVASVQSVDLVLEGRRLVLRDARATLTDGSTFRASDWGAFVVEV